jgi:hypothetical protein
MIVCPLSDATGITPDNGRPGYGKVIIENWKEKEEEEESVLPATASARKENDHHATT